MLRVGADATAGKNHIRADPFQYIYIMGLILFASTVIITINNLKEQVIYWVFFPGTIGGIGIILLGLFLVKYLKKVEERKKMATIIKKLLK